VSERSGRVGRTRQRARGSLRGHHSPLPQCLLGVGRQVRPGAVADERA